MLLRGTGRRDACLVGLTTAAAAVLYPGALLKGQSFFDRDLHLDWYPRLFAIARCLREGQWPLWDRSIAFGQPLLADPGTQVAYPLAWPALLVPLASAYTAYVLLHLLLAALGTARLAQRLGAGRIGSHAAAAFFVLGGPLQSSLNLWHHFAGACWMPWVLLAGERLACAPGPSRVALLAAVSGMQLLAGSADVAAMTWAAALAWAVFRLAVSRRRRATALRAGAGFLAGALLAAGLAAVVWMPAAHVALRSARRELPADVRTAWSLPSTGLVRLAAPIDARRVPFVADRWRALYDGAELPLLPSLYLGLGVLGCCAVAAGSRRLRARVTMLGATALACVAFAMGPHGPVYAPLAALLPPLRVFRYPSKAMLLGSLVVALAGGLGVAAIARRRASTRALVSAVFVLLSIGLAALLAASRDDPGAARGATPVLALLLGLLLVALALGRVSPTVAAVAAGCVCAVDLVAAHTTLNATGPAELILGPPPVLGRIDRTRRLYVYDYHSLPGTSQRLLGRSDPYRTVVPPPGVDPRLVAAAALRQYLPPPSAGLFGVEGSYDLDIRGLYPRALIDVTLALRVLEGTPAHARMLRLGAVGTVLSLHTSGLTDLRLVATLPSLFPEPIRVWTVPGALPRAWLVGCSRAPADGAALQTLTDAAFDPEREVLLPEGSPTQSACGEAGRARLTALLSDELKLDVDAERAAYLVVADAYDPGWKAEIDGASAPLWRANVAFQAVPVPAGRHRVRLLYRPREVVQGAAVSTVSVVAAVGLALAGAARARRRRLSRAPGTAAQGLQA